MRSSTIQLLTTEEGRLASRQRSHTNGLVSFERTIKQPPETNPKTLTTVNKQNNYKMTRAGVALLTEEVSSTVTRSYMTLILIKGNLRKIYSGLSICSLVSSHWQQHQLWMRQKLIVNDIWKRTPWNKNSLWNGSKTLWKRRHQTKESKWVAFIDFFSYFERSFGHRRNLKIDRQPLFKHVKNESSLAYHGVVHNKF